MRRSTTTALGLVAVFTVLALTGCAGQAEPADASAASSTPARRGSSTPSASATLSSAQLNQRLLNESDLGEGYTRKPETTRRNDDVTVIGCPALAELGSDAATGSGLDFTHKAKASFTYTGSSSSEVSEELYSDSPAKLSTVIGKVFDAMLSCPTYQVTSGSTVVDMGTERTAAPDLGDEQWSQLLTFSAGGRRSVVKQTAIRTSNILVIVSGSPGLVDAHLDKALAKARTAR
ncbi:hypothetical protein ACM01_04015 [Streptomyces viridochromogenes]|uniref:Secreted protein n=1 Tax=Streptomyces viridochromogenes TaxID=1938 RepID=A0A0J7ZLW2_STRVR|nr:hypothetical protein [Streptomyces viridochromogenes]KMS76986.1 hypothetical protein ACM01_04015 [Streptomyces viridochromogenes]